MLIHCCLLSRARARDSGHTYCLHYTADGSVAGSFDRVVPRGRRHSCCRCGAFVFSLSEHVSPLVASQCMAPGQPAGLRLTAQVRRVLTFTFFLKVRTRQSDGVPLAGLGPRIDLQPVVCSGSSFAAQMGRRISVLRWGSKGSTVLPSTPVVWRLVLSALLWPSCCADFLFSSLVRGSGLRAACRLSNEHEDGRLVALKTA